MLFTGGNVKLGVWSVTLLDDPCDAPKPIPLFAKAL